MKRHLTTGQIAKHLAVAPRTVVKWIDNGQLPGYRLPGDASHRRVRQDDCLRFLQEHGMPDDWLADAQSGAPRV